MECAHYCDLEVFGSIQVTNRKKKKKTINRKQLYILFELTMVDLSQPFQGGEKPDYINLKFINSFLSLQVVSPFFFKLILC